MRIITAHYENAFRGELGREGSFFCGPVVALHSRCNSFLQMDFTSRYRLRRMRGLHCCSAAPTLAWPVIVRSVAPRGGESRHGTKRSVVTQSSNVPPLAFPFSLCSRAVRWRVNIYRLRHNSRNAPPNGLLLSGRAKGSGMKL